MFFQITTAITVLFAAFVINSIYTPPRHYPITDKLAHCAIGHRAAPVAAVTTPNTPSPKAAIAPEEGAAAPEHAKGVPDVNGFIIPENTLSSFQLSQKSGIRTVELDVQMTKDNVLVVFHDAIIGATLDVKDVTDMAQKHICELNWDELNTMPFQCATQQPNSPYLAERVTRLSEVLAFCKANNMNIMIEVKPQPNLKVVIQQVVAQVEETKMVENVYVASFHPGALLWTRWFSKTIATGFLFTPEAVSGVKAEYIRQGKTLPGLLKYDFLATFIDSALRFLGSPHVNHVLGNAIIAPQFTYLSPFNVKQYQAWGQTVLTWTVNEVVQQDYLFDQLKVSVITDFPRLEMVQRGTDKV